MDEELMKLIMEYADSVRFAAKELNARGDIPDDDAELMLENAQKIEQFLETPQ